MTGSRREAVDLGTTLAGELGSVLAGLRLDVRGAEHLACRPAVFLFNHQSQLDVLILAKLPDGTRSVTPALGPFKKGAFHVAMHAGVPIMPIVIRNAGELM